jgi:hypothetical protein
MGLKMIEGLHPWSGKYLIAYARNEGEQLSVVFGMDEAEADRLMEEFRTRRTISVHRPDVARDAVEVIRPNCVFKLETKNALTLVPIPASEADDDGK